VATIRGSFGAKIVIPARRDNPQHLWSQDRATAHAMELAGREETRKSKPDGNPLKPGARLLGGRELNEKS
jgi:hypothetical protein